MNSHSIMTAIDVIETLCLARLTLVNEVSLSNNPFPEAAYDEWQNLHHVKRTLLKELDAAHEREFQLCMPF